MYPTVLPVFLCLFAVVFAGCHETSESAADAAAVATAEATVENRGANADAWWNALPRAAWSGFPRVSQSQPWYEVYRVRDHVLAIYEPGQFEEVISYLILGDESALLFDTGLGIGDMPRLVAELTDLPVQVLNSHSHYDHTGGNDGWPDRIAGAVTAFTAAALDGREPQELAEFIGPGWIWKPLPETFAPATYGHAPYAITRAVNDSDRFDLGGIELEVIRTPGHTPDSLCLLDRQARLLFMGDTLYPAPLYTHLHGGSFAAYAQSAAKLAAFADAVDVLLPAHNEPVMPADTLLQLRDAFAAMPEGSAAYAAGNGIRTYEFERFSVIVAEPPPWE